MADDPKNETYSEEETVARREAALKRMLNTPHKPHKPHKKSKKGLSMVSWVGVEREMAEQILAQGEKFMAAQLQAALAADSRATAMAGMCITLALASIAGGVAWNAGDHALAYLLGGFTCGAFLLLAAGRAAWAARPIDFYFPGNQPSQWWPNNLADLTGMIGGEAENYDERIEYNQERLSENQGAIADAFVLAITAPILGAVVWSLIYFFSRA